MRVARLTERGLPRVLDGKVGMTFVIDRTTISASGTHEVAHVRDYRYPAVHFPFQIWTLGLDDWEEVYE